MSIILDMGDFDAVAFGLWLRKNREGLKLSVSDLARRSGVSKQYISALEQANPHLLTNKPVQPGLDKVEQIAGALSADLDEARLIAGYEPRAQPARKPQSVAEFVERLSDMGFDFYSFSRDETVELSPDDLQELMDQIEANILLKTQRKRQTGRAQRNA